MGIEAAVVFALIAVVVCVGIMLAVGIPRAKRMEQTNNRIAENQARIMALHERQAAALERIAEKLESR